MDGQGKGLLNRKTGWWRIFFVCLVALQVLLLHGPEHIPWLTPHDSIADEIESSTETSTSSEPNLIFTWVIAPGDTLSSIFARLQINKSTIYEILSADESLLALDVLRNGQILTFTIDGQTRRLMEIELFIHPGHRIVYHRTGESEFDYEEIVLPGEWREEALSGEINGSFYTTAVHAGMTERETITIADLFRERLNFTCEIRAGDVFQAVRSRQFVDGEFTGHSRIEGVRIFCGKYIHSAFLFDDGNYYDSEGNSLAYAFRRYPMTGRHRVSSQFNPARLHPSTHRIAPHNGVDFAMPTGTPVLSTGDGVVTRVHSHPFAGKYVEIQHGSQYTTRYLHLSRILVKVGQRIKRGDQIALSGNTGRSIAPHLHFELHVNGRPVNPLTAKIPMMAAVPDKRRPEFNQRVGKLVTLMEQPSSNIALHQADTPS
ncbi:MAG TPA: peptidoglycan DD-metalloendopeptidase family protein [Syntrophales bacterium]|nr:peptidoglycan DD-metalloendopeptidase family protein [Syntrophales bacterium]